MLKALDYETLELKIIESKHVRTEIFILVAMTVSFVTVTKSLVYGVFGFGDAVKTCLSTSAMTVQQPA